MMNLLGLYVGHNCHDPVPGAWVKNNCFLRSYQSDALRNIFDAAMSGQGGRFAVMFPRQSGKNETQAQLEAALMAANQHRGGNIIKIIPTEKNQGKISTERLASVLSGTRGRLSRTSYGRGRLSRTSYGEPSPKGNCLRERDEASEGNGNLTSRACIRRNNAVSFGDRQREGNEASEGNGNLTSRACVRRNDAVSFDDRQREGNDPSEEKRSLTSRASIRRNGAVSFGDGSPYEVRDNRPRPFEVCNNRPRVRVKKDEITYGNTSVRCLSASPNAAIVGATAELLLEVDEAQMVAAEKYDREAAPMAAANNAVQVFWGTAWDDQTLLARETRLAQKEEELDGRKHVFTTTAVEVGKEVPEYENFVRSQIELLGREHPAIRTQFFCEEITDLTSMFTEERMNKMKGDHDPLYRPEKDKCYVFLIDVAGSDEVQAKDKRAHGFSDRRDATVVTICEVILPNGKKYDAKNFVWKVVNRRLFRNVPTDLLEKENCGDIDLWKPRRIFIDHSGLGAMLSDILVTKYKTKVCPIDITAANKTKMAWDFLAMVDTGRWLEHKGNEIDVLKSGFKPGKERYEILKEPELLQQMFYRELRACRIEPTGNPSNVSWGVKDGTRDQVTGRYLHDDLVMSAAMSVFENGKLNVRNDLSHDSLIDQIKLAQELQKQQERKRRFGW